jgi:hypothetical protein
MHGRLYTWSNGQSHPVLERVDRAFACLSWCNLYPQFHLRATSTCCSNHAPLLLHTNTGATTMKRFQFEPIWPKFPGYLDAVAASCQIRTGNAGAFWSLN